MQEVREMKARNSVSSAGGSNTNTAPEQEFVWQHPNDVANQGDFFEKKDEGVRGRSAEQVREMKARTSVSSAGSSDDKAKAKLK